MPIDDLASCSSKKVSSKRDLPYLAYNVLFFVCFALFCCAIQIPSFRFVNGRGDWASPALYFFLVAISFLFGVVLQIWGQKVFRIRINPLFVAIFALFFVGGLIGALCHESLLVFDGSQRLIEIDDSNGLVRLMSITNTLLTSYGLFLFFNFAPSTRKRRSSGYLVAEAFVLLGLVAVIYSFIFEWQEYANILRYGMRPWDYIASFPQSKNVYGLYLLIAVFAEMFLMEIDGRRIRYVMMAFFMVAILFSTSKTAILISFASFFVYLVYRFLTLKKKKALTIKGMAIPFAIIAFFGVSAIVLAVLKPSFLDSLGSMIAKFFSVEEGSSSGARIDIWSDCIRLISQNPVHWIFGHGDVVYPYLLSGSMDVPSIGTSHNFVLEVLGRGGILRLLCLCLFCAFVIYRLVRRMKVSRKDCFLPLLIIVTMTLRQLIECVFVFDITASSLDLMYFSIILIFSNAEEEGVETSKETGGLSSAAFHWCGVPISIAVAIPCIFIPAEYGWIYGLSWATFIGLSWAIWRFVRKGSSNFWITFPSLLFGIACMTACSPFSRSFPVDITISLSCLAGYLSCRFALMAFVPQEKEGTLEFLYDRLLIVVDRNN